MVATRRSCERSCPRWAEPSASLSASARNPSASAAGRGEAATPADAPSVTVLAVRQPPWHAAPLLGSVEALDRSAPSVLEMCVGIRWIGRKTLDYG